MKNGDSPVSYKVLMLYQDSFDRVLWICYEKIPNRVMKLREQVETEFSMQYRI